MKLLHSMVKPLRFVAGVWLTGLVGLMGFASVAVATPLSVVTTTGMIADVVLNVGKNHVAVRALMGTGVDPHLYKATQGDLRRLLKADVIFFNGLHLEGKMQKIFDKMGKRNPVIAVSESIDEQGLLSFNKNFHDPHIWFDVQLWQQATKTIIKELSRLDSPNAVAYQQHGQAYLHQLEALHLWVKAQILTIPKKQRVLITAHDAFGYFGRAYGMDVRGLQGISTATEFGLHDIKQLKKVVVARGIKAVFVESSVPKKFLQALVLGVQAEGGQLEIGGELFSDAMGLKNTEEGTYIGMVRHNVNTIVGALK